MSLPYNGKHIPLAKSLRSHATPQENHLWYDFLSTYPVRFQRQKVIDSFIADFYCHRVNLVIEIDGSQHFSPTGMQRDRFRTEVLNAHGLIVVRFTNPQINHQFREVCEYIDYIVKERLGRSASLHEGGGIAARR